jgi:formate dehydrogenase subunit delta
MMSTEERLVYMANQIARNFAHAGDGAIAATADHIAKFWDPRMRGRILAGDPQQLGLSEIAAGAFQLLRERGAAKAG